MALGLAHALDLQRGDVVENRQMRERVIWNIMDVGRAAGASTDTSCPSIRTVPELISSCPAIILSSEVLPQPDGPRGNSKADRRSAGRLCAQRRLPYIFCRLLSSRLKSVVGEILVTGRSVQVQCSRDGSHAWRKHRGVILHSCGAKNLSPGKPSRALPQARMSKKLEHTDRYVATLPPDRGHARQPVRPIEMP